jgi:two-component system, OmpR family, response regulator ResD
MSRIENAVLYLAQLTGPLMTRQECVPTRVLVVDDEPTVTEVVDRYLRLEGYEVAMAADGAEALDVSRQWSPDLIVLDLMLPAVDGLEVCRQLRRDSRVPIIMLTARGEEADRIVGLELGADDYMVKPFSPRELVARVKSVLRRASSGPDANAGGLVRFGPVSINPRTREVVVEGRAANLTAKEFDLLLHMASHPGQVFTREQLMDQVWDYTYAADYSTITVHIRRLREKVEADPMRPRYIKTVWGVGYKLEAQAA